MFRIIHSCNIDFSEYYKLATQMHVYKSKLQAAAGD